MQNILHQDVGKATQPYEFYNYELESQILKTKTRIIDLIYDMSNSIGPRRGMRKIGNISEIRQLRNYSSELKRLVGLQNDY